MKTQHKIQLQILKRLLFATEIRYSDLKPEGEMENNQFDFHLDQLIKEGHIIKANGLYSLSAIGKEYANRMDTEKVVMARQAKISVLICPIRIYQNKQQYLIYTRLKQPFYGCQGFMTGKVLFGESILTAAKRELKEETNLTGNPQIVSVRHYRVINPETKDFIEDKIMFLCKVENPKGKVIPNEEGKFEWVDREKLYSYIKKHFVSRKDLTSALKDLDLPTGRINFQEIPHLGVSF